MQKTVTREQGFVFDKKAMMARIQAVSTSLCMLRLGGLR